MPNDAFPQRLSSQTIYESDWVSLYADRVRMPDGSIIERYHRLHIPQQSVGLAVVNDSGDLLLIRSKRYVTGRLEWEVPAGRIEPGETPEQAAQRECQEETGCTLRSLRYLCRQNPCNGMSDLTLHLFAATVDTEAAGIDENEVAAKCWVPRQRVLQMLQDNEIQCGVSMLTLLYALTFGDL